MADLHKSVADDDPYEFAVMRYEAEPGTDPDAIMARCFVEEFALMGYRPERILRLFQLATYTGAHDILSRNGEPFVRRIIEDVFGAPLPPVVAVLMDEGNA